MNKGKKILKFKNEKYDYETLLDKYCNSQEEKFRMGIVEELEDGNEFEINYLPDVFLEKNNGVIDSINHLTYSQKSGIRKQLSNSVVNYKKKVLKKKLDDDEITKEELEEYILLIDKRNIKEETRLRDGIKAQIITRFVKVNQEFPLPREISLTNVGRYYRLLEVLIQKNKIFKKPHGNSKEPTKAELMEYLQCNSTNTFRTFIQEMEQYKVARRFKVSNNRNVIFINPLYAHKDLIISKELYNVFKDVLEEKLEKRILKYMQFIFEENEVDGSISYTDK